ncbi:MAG: divalent-cation tolerance protein CutA, partial [Xanthobacteraceae bacterium]
GAVRRCGIGGLVRRLFETPGGPGKSAANAVPRELSMERAVFVYTTFPSVVEAERAGRVLVERRLCACVNILPGMVSLYWWQGAIERGEEAVMIIKTRASLAEAVRGAVKEMHSYTTPAILVIPLESVDPDYHAWIVHETEGTK